jgi:hypothetical protein
MFDPKAHLIQFPRRVNDRASGQYVTVYDDYLEVKWRVLMFREKYPHGVITTEETCVDLDRGYARYKATVADGEGGHATGYGTETKADFPDFCERAETRALGRAMAVLGFGTQFVGQDLAEMPHMADAPVAQSNGHAGHTPANPGMAANPDGGASTETPVNPGSEELSANMAKNPPDATRLTPDQACELKRLAQTAFGYAEGERRLRADLGFEVDERLSLRHLAAHVPVARYEALVAAYTARLQAVVERDVP